MLMLRRADEQASRIQALFPSWRGREPIGDRVARVRSSLLDRQPKLDQALQRLPFQEYEAADRIDGPVRKYHVTPPAAAALLGRVAEALRPAWLCALMLWHIERFEERFAATGLDDEFRLHYADAFHRILDQIESDVAFASPASDSFCKDLWLTRLVMIPAFAQVWWPHSGLAARAILAAGPSAAAYVFLRCGGRAPFLEGHTHDPVAKAYWNEGGWREALRLAALALPAIPAARGVFGTAWFYDPKLKEITPRLSFAQDLQVGLGARRIRIGSNDAAIRNATLTSTDRRARYEEGSYLPTDYAVIWSRKDLTAAYGA